MTSLLLGTRAFQEAVNKWLFIAKTIILLGLFLQVPYQRLPGRFGQENIWQFFACFGHFEPIKDYTILRARKSH